MRVIPEGLYLCRNGQEVAIVHCCMFGGGPFPFLVEYARHDGAKYAEPSLGKVNSAGYVWGKDQPDPRDLVEFIEFYNINGDIEQ